MFSTSRKTFIGVLIDEPRLLRAARPALLDGGRPSTVVGLSLQMCASSTAAGRSGFLLILIMQPHPAHHAADLIAALGCEVEPHEGAIEQIEPARIGRVRVIDDASIILGQDAATGQVGLGIVRGAL